MDVFIKTAALAAATSCFLFLAACGGGGGGAGGAGGIDLSTVNTAVMGQQPILYAGGFWVEGRASCQGAVCTITVLDVTERTDFSGETLSWDGATLISEPSRHGVQVAHATMSEDGLHRSGYGAWGTYNSAWASVARETFQGTVIEFVTSLSLGWGPGSNPVSGGATWTGAMVGVELLATEPGPDVLGNARMQVDFSDASLALAFTNIVAPASSTRYADIGWQDVPMRGGSFRGLGLDGRFYGPNHEEAGGVFHSNGISGGFSLARQ